MRQLKNQRHSRTEANNKPKHDPPQPPTPISAGDDKGPPRDDNMDILISVAAQIVQQRLLLLRLLLLRLLLLRLLLLLG